MITKRSLFGIACRAAALTFLAAGSASLMQAQQSPSIQVTPAAPLFLASESAPLDLASTSSSSSSSSSTDSVVSSDGNFLFSSAAHNRASRAMIVNHSTGSRLTPAFVDLIVRHSLDNSDEQAFGRYLPSWARADILARIKGNEVPVKVITGEYDPTQPAEFMEQAWLQVYPNSELEVLRGTGHYPMYETPVALAVSIEEFLARG